MKNAIGIVARHRWRRWSLLGLCGASLAACGGSAGDTALPSAVLAASKGVGGAAPRRIDAGTMFTVVNLDPASSAAPPAINAGNQVAFTVYRDWRTRAGFFNGDAVRAIDSFGGAESSAGALNDAGQVAGVATDADEVALGFRWSEAGGMVALGTLGAAPLQPSAINRAGQLTGWASDADPAATPRAFFWSDGDGARGLGELGPGSTVGEALNDAGMVAGTSPAPDGSGHAFVWNAAAGMLDLGTNGGAESSARLINNNGQVAGSFRIAGGGDMAYRGFVWSAPTGMVDIGTLDGDYSHVSAMNQAGQVAGGAHFGCGDCVHAITWSAAAGLADLGVLGGIYSDAFGINGRGEVVGWADTASSSASFFHAFVWTGATGMVDLNERIANAPAGLELTAALAISDDGAIVADSNAGMVLLVPGGGGTDAPLVGPILPDGPVTAGTPVTFAATFSDRNGGDRHGATWSWNDGCGADIVTKVRGPGTVRTRHTFCAPGQYWITFKVTDSGGRSTTVGRYVMVDEPAGATPSVAGSGWFVSPRCAYRQQRMHSGPAQFGFVARRAGAPGLQERKATLRFRVANLTFESDACDNLAVAGARAQYKGGGTLNGAGGYRFLLEAVGAAAGPAQASRGRLRMKIWHVDARSKAEVVDYDNQAAIATVAAGSEGSAVASGSIVIRQ